MHLRTKVTQGNIISKSLIKTVLTVTVFYDSTVQITILIIIIRMKKMAY